MPNLIESRIEKLERSMGENESKIALSFRCRECGQPIPSLDDADCENHAAVPQAATTIMISFIEPERIQ
ncbi:hypothetical protein [Imhoffiella purpurea]|uniref:hypothetical protein n=1 Tax=Imhoffiella purpurea TaxID=1249627 RepID=UPI0012FD41E5|nr:hypothetical protein [Imhoffiella purpurea]